MTTFPTNSIDRPRLISFVMVVIIFMVLIDQLTPLRAQETAPDTVSAMQALAPKVFLDCNMCDTDHIRTEVSFVNYVRDRLQADAHVLVTTQRTGSGGLEYTLTFIGQNRAKGIDDTLTFTTRQSDTDEMVRTAFVRVYKIGLARYVARTPLGEHLTVSYKAPTKPAVIIDKWDYWVFRISLNSNMNGEKTYSSFYFSGGFSARRVTEDWKLNFSLNANYNESRFDYGGTKTLSLSRGQSFNSTVVKSLDNHWSLGGFASAWTSTYDNYEYAINIAPAIEYNIFPYPESTRRQLRILYRIGGTQTKYLEETIFNATSDLLYSHSLSLSLELKQPWGSISSSLTGSHYLHDFSKRRLNLFSGLSLRLWEGLSLNLYGNVSRINDQLSLRRGTATQEEILLRRTRLATNYQYWAFIGLSYTFGSIYNNIVNPRFGDSSSGVSISF